MPNLNKLSAVLAAQSWPLKNFNTLELTKSWSYILLTLLCGGSYLIYIRSFLMNPQALPQNDLIELIKFLELKKISISNQLSSIDQDDPIMDQIPGATESGTEAWEADVHVKSIALKAHLNDSLKQIQLTLVRLKNGSYGSCMKCHKTIESERLKAIPTATHCLSCIPK